MSGEPDFSLVVGDIISDAREKTGDVVRVTEQELESSTWLLGVQGTGKSSLIEHYVWQLAGRTPAKGMIIIDPHGDLVDNIIKQLPAWRVQNTYLLDITDKEFFYGINIFDAKDIRDGGTGDRDQAIDRVVDTFLKLFEGADRGVMLPKVLRFITSVMIANAGMSIADVPRLLKDDAFREELVKPVTHHWTREYWREYGEMTNKAKGDETRSLNNRLQTLLSMELIEYIMGQAQTTIDFRTAMDNNEILLIRLPVADYPVIAPLIGTALVTEMFRTVFSYRDTPRERRRGFSLFVDEAHNFVTDQFAKLITEGRKYGLRLFIGNQTHSQLQGRNHDEILNCRTRVALRLNDDDARSMAAAFVDRTKQPKLKQLYWDVLKRLGEHKSEWIYKFNENVVKRIIEIAKDDDYTHYEDAKRAVPIVEKLLIETQKQGVIPEGLLNKYLTAMEGLCEYDPPSPIFYTKERLEIKEDEYEVLTEKCLAVCQEQIDNNKQDETAGTYSNELVKQIDASGIFPVTNQGKIRDVFMFNQGSQPFPYQG